MDRNERPWTVNNIFEDFFFVKVDFMFGKSKV